MVFVASHPRNGKKPEKNRDFSLKKTLPKLTSAVAVE